MLNVQIGERLGCLRSAIGQGVAALDVVHDLARDVGQHLVLGLLRQDVERLHQRQAGVDHGGELPRKDHDVARPHAG